MVTSQAVPVPINRLKLADPGHQQQRAAERAGQHVGDEMRPGIAAWLQRDQRDGEQRQRARSAR